MLAPAVEISLLLVTAGVGVEDDGVGEVAPKPPKPVEVCPKENPAVVDAAGEPKGEGEDEDEDVTPKVDLGADEIDFVLFSVVAAPNGLGAFVDIGGYPSVLELGNELEPKLLFVVLFDVDT